MAEALDDLTVGSDLVATPELCSIAPPARGTSSVPAPPHPAFEVAPARGCPPRTPPKKSPEVGGRAPLDAPRARQVLRTPLRFATAGTPAHAECPASATDMRWAFG